MDYTPHLQYRTTPLPRAIYALFAARNGRYKVPQICLSSYTNRRLWYCLGFNPKFLYTKLHRPSGGIFVGCTALKALLKTLVYVVFTFIICQNTHSTNTTCAFNPLLQVCKWFGELVFITLVVMSSDDLSHWEKFTDISTFPWLGPSNFV